MTTAEKTHEAEAKAEAKAEARRARDNRRIVQGVQLPAEGGGVRTYAADTSEECDALEAVLTTEQCNRLKEQGALEGDWHPKGKAAPPMRNSRAAGGRVDLEAEVKSLKEQHTKAVVANEKLEAHNKELEEEIAALKGNKPEAAAKKVK